MKQNIEHKNSKGQLHCEYGPAIIYYYENGNKKSEIYYLNDQRHRADGPTIIDYFENNNKQEEHYFLNNKHHRTDGPAHISYLNNGNKKSEKYYLNDLTLENWCKTYNVSFKTKHEKKYVIDNLEKIYKTVSIFK
jgi:antitoxin component YwqK of YwqJK toxin-antitoxin module